MKILRVKKKPLKPGNIMNENEVPDRLSGDIHRDLEAFKKEIGQNSDVHFRGFNLGLTNVQGVLIFVEGLADKDLIDKYIIKSLMHGFTGIQHDGRQDEKKRYTVDNIKRHILYLSNVQIAARINETIPHILKGFAVLLLDGSSEMLILDTVRRKTRSIEEPVSEQAVRGPREGFTEDLCDNQALLRKNGGPKLTFSKFIVGKRTKKDLVVAYIEDIANPSIVEEVKSRIQEIDIDHVMESGYVEQLIEDNYISPFPQVQNTERPDRVMAALMEGRVAILLDGTPFALLVPVTFSMMLQASEDYYERWVSGSLIRLLRFVAIFISLFGPALYIAFVSFHQGLIPTKLAMSIIGTRDGVPFPSIIEALIMEVAIEILREAGLRLPKPIGPAIGIVGALIIGEAAVSAGIVSPIMVIVVAVTAISSFAIPEYSLGISLRYLRFGCMFFAAVFGLYGVILFFLLLSSHLVKLKSFGVPYISLAVPYRLSDWKDFIIRFPLKVLKQRPSMLNPKDPVRKS